MKGRGEPLNYACIQAYDAQRQRVRTSAARCCSMAPSASCRSAICLRVANCSSSWPDFSAASPVWGMISLTRCAKGKGWSNRV